MKGDFIGFKFNNISNEDLGIIRVSNGDRYDDTLLPELEDKTIDIPGNDGQYYFNSDFNQKSFTINIAFDSLTEDQLRKVKKTFSTKDIVPLVFEERPYVTYYGKISNPPEFHYICFDEEDLTKPEKTDILKKSIEFPVLYPPELVVPTNNPNLDGHPVGGGDERVYKLEKEYISTKHGIKRIYKGEGSFTFTCYFPFGRCNKKFLQEYKEKKSEEGEEPEVWEWKEEFKNGDEWAAASKLLETNHSKNKEGEIVEIDTYKFTGSGTDYQGIFWVYNPSDREVPPLITIPGSFLQSELQISMLNSLSTRTIVLDPIELQGEDTGIIINCQNHLIEGIGGRTTLKNIYNKYIKRGNFFNIPYTEIPEILYIKGDSVGTGAEIQYDYLYI